MLKRKAISLSIILVMLFSVTTSSFAQTSSVSDYEMQKQSLISTINILEEVDNATHGLIDGDVSEDILKNIDVGIGLPNKTLYNDLDINHTSDMFDIKHTIKKVGDIVHGNGNIGTMYSLTALAKQKESSNEESEAGIVSYITLIWIDNFGPENELIGIYGGWTPNGKVLSDRQVHWSVDGNSAGSGNPYENSFYYDTSEEGFSFTANTGVDVKNYPYTVFCSVRTSIID